VAKEMTLGMSQTNTSLLADTVVGFDHLGRILSKLYEDQPQTVSSAAIKNRNHGTVKFGARTAQVLCDESSAPAWVLCGLTHADIYWQLS
jgi:hypothetical protein